MHKSVGIVVVVIATLTFDSVLFRSKCQGHRLKVTPAALSEPCNVATIFGLKTADCSGKHLVTIPDVIDFDIQVLRMTNNLLRSLYADIFRSCPNLQEVYLARNKVKVVSEGTFLQLQSLQILDMDENQLEKVPSAALRDLSSLRILTLKGNPIRSLEEFDLDGLTNLEKLDVESCQLTYVHGRTFSRSSKLIELNLVGNQLADLPPIMEHSLPESLSVLRLHRNPWTCDCHLRWLRKWIDTPKESDAQVGVADPRQSESTGGDYADQSAHTDQKTKKKKKFRVSWDFATNTPVCSNPPLIRNVAWKYLTQEQFACPGRIVLSNTTVSVVERRNATLECLYSGDPEPRVVWKSRHLSPEGAPPFRPDAELQWPSPFLDRETPSSSFQVVQRRGDDESNVHPSSLLVIPRVLANQSGDYTCVVENSAGRAEVTFKLVVVSESSRHLGNSSSRVDALHPDEGDIWRRESVLGVTASLVVIAPLMFFSILLWHLKRRKDKGKRKNPFNKSLAVPLTERNNDACATDDDDANEATATPSLVRKQNGGTSKVFGSAKKFSVSNDIRQVNRDATNQSSSQDFELDVVATSSKEKLLQLSKKKADKRRVQRETGYATEKSMKRSLAASGKNEHPFQDKMPLPEMQERRHPIVGRPPNNEEKKKKDHAKSWNSRETSSDHFPPAKDQNKERRVNRKCNEDADRDSEEVPSNCRHQPQRKLSASDAIGKSTSSTTASGSRSSYQGDSLKYGTWSSQSSTGSTATSHVFANFNSVPMFDVVSNHHISSASAISRHHHHHHHPLPRHPQFLPEVPGLLTGNSHLIGPAPPLPDDFPSFSRRKTSPTLVDDTTYANDYHIDHFNDDIAIHTTITNTSDNNSTANNNNNKDDFRLFHYYPQSDCDRFSMMKMASSSLYEHPAFLRDCNRCPSDESLKPRSRDDDKY